MEKISIDKLIEMLEYQKNKGAKNVIYKGTFLTDNGNTVIISTEKQF